jgi:hypothetical protein
MAARVEWRLKVVNKKNRIKIKKKDPDLRTIMRFLEPPRGNGISRRSLLWDCSRKKLIEVASQSFNAWYARAGKDADD